MTLAEITDVRLDVIAHAREVLERARSECLAWRGAYSRKLSVTAAIGVLESALRWWGEARSEEEKDKAVVRCARRSVRLVSITGAVMGPEAAAYVSGEGGEE